MKEAIRSIVVAILTLEAKAILAKYRPKIILVTGSVGKTSTKDATYAALASSTFVRKSEKSYNSDIGAPLTILGVKNGWGNMIQWVRNIIDGALLIVITAPYPKWLIVEVGADRPGDISRRLAWLKPDVVVTTRIPTIPVHVEFYENPEDVAAEELAPLSWLTGGIAVISADDTPTPFVGSVKRITYGLAEGADVRVSDVRTIEEGGVVQGVNFTISYQGATQSVMLTHVVGESHVRAAAAGAAAALAAGATLESAAAGLMTLVPPPGRMRIIPGKDGSTIIDDTYNSSPVATEEALRTLAGLPATRRIAVLADMLELGTYSAAEHERIGRLAASTDMLITVGVRAQAIAEGMRAAQKEGEAETRVIRSFDRGSDASAFLLTILKEGDVALIKGSQSMRMERVVKSVMAEPNKAKDLLCRQDAEWLAR